MALVVDGSSMITQSDPANWGRVLGFLLRLLEKFELSSRGTRVAVVVYGDEGQVVFYLNTYSSSVSGFNKLIGTFQ